MALLNKSLALLVIATLLVCGTCELASAQAAPLPPPGPSTASADYGDFVGDAVRFENVAEDDISTSPIGTLFFGAPSTVGDTLRFRPSGFRTLAASGGIEFQDGQLRVDVVGINGATFSSIRIEEGGAYRVVGDGNVASAAGVGFVQTDAGTFENTFTFDQTGTGVGSWTGDLTFQFPETDRATLTFDNLLLADALESPGLAFIDKKIVDIIVDPTPGVPEPTALALLGLSGIALAARRRRQC